MALQAIAARQPVLLPVRALRYSHSVIYFAYSSYLCFLSHLISATIIRRNNFFKGIKGKKVDVHESQGIG